MTQHTSRAQRGCPSSRNEGKEEGFSEVELSAFRALADHKAEEMERKAGTDQHPHSPWALRAQVLAWELSLGGAATSFSELGLLLPGADGGSWHLVAGRVPARAAQESGGRVRPGAVSVGNRGLQLLQAAPAEFCSIRLSILGQLLCAH
jgi:hypothetical protein